MSTASKVIAQTDTQTYIHTNTDTKKTYAGGKNSFCPPECGKIKEVTKVHFTKGRYKIGSSQNIKNRRMGLPSSVPSFLNTVTFMYFRFTLQYLFYL